MATQIAFLRGVNVGGRNRVPMAALRDALEAAGFTNVRTHLQSGNVLVDTETPAGTTSERIAGTIEDAFGLDITVLVRTPAQIARLANPFLDVEPDGAKTHVVFLAEKPAGARVEKLDPERSPPDAFAVVGRELFAHYPNGAGRSKLTLDYLERTLDTRGTARNWNTVCALLELARVG